MASTNDVPVQAMYRLLDSIVEVASHDGRSLRRQEALAMITGLVGALTLSRATDDEDFAFELLESTRARLASMVLANRTPPFQPAK